MCGPAACVDQRHVWQLHCMPRVAVFDMGAPTPSPRRVDKHASSDGVRAITPHLMHTPHLMRTSPLMRMPHLMSAPHLTH
mmetsp:Transcript_41110/g.122705  ORF Transcript_41110/g.122705 Transcript_41110/m.122705 type:complete len:80 (-) Transcript_41110:162-401(-)